MTKIFFYTILRAENSKIIKMIQVKDKLRWPLEIVLLDQMMLIVCNRLFGCCNIASIFL